MFAAHCSPESRLLEDAYVGFQPSCTSRRDSMHVPNISADSSALDLHPRS